MNKLMPAKEWQAYCRKIYAEAKFVIDGVLREELDWNGKPIEKKPARKSIKSSPKVCK